MLDTIYKRIFNVFQIKANQIQMIRYVFYKFYVREILMRKQLKYIFFITILLGYVLDDLSLSIVQHFKQETL